MELQEGDYSRVIAIGDLHGHLSPLKRLLEKIDLKSGDYLIFIGDYIDRGPESKQLVQELIDLRFSHPGITFLRGNHEDMLLGTLGYGGVVSDMNTWLYNGGAATLFSYGLQMDALNRIAAIWDIGERRAELSKVLPKGHLEFFLDLELYVETENHFFCHAGVDPSVSLEMGKQNMYDLLWMREHLYADEPVWDKTLVCGHTPLQGILATPKLICIDTGLHYYGKLSAIDVISREVYQVGMEAFA